jgi:hypothetical protein
VIPSFIQKPNQCPQEKKKNKQKKTKKKKNKQTIQPLDAFEGTVFSWGLKLSESKPRCRVAHIHFFVRYISPMSF